ncbi:SDR family NAD(P)-dependent oxidoreductase [Desulfosporosinus sp. BICA1-9]|uniref:SDR family NAD(P)-dependent oxidoreductase n=1 Tax=Desulfosporosinus sp. BICA1-9 TaxID=1531958 RepID=UPI00054B165A|nr:SDR family NAD(P)-dependent oxidoreductase [Desulfosporosinus sp. BICA1-9]KJS50561.1 MAG: hypothetical protein VR66_02055 [Peptococcaceae bacterium BRH_c23]KJS82827.1 MAG: hypothetical protein JL57_23700 [Desulfosporosinus sp. BICA1-9]
MNELLGKYAVITGAAGGIGAATAMTFAKEGAKGIVIADLNIEKAEETSELISNETGCMCIAEKVNVADYSDIKKLFEVAAKKFESLDILVNGAGICPVGSIEEIGDIEWDMVMNINLRSAYLCSREAFTKMKQRKYGKVINISSISGRIGGIATGVNYAVSKGGIIALTMSLAKAVGPFNINVNCIAPGFIDTQMTKNFNHFDPETVPLRRIGTPEDVADVIQFLASERSRYITGVTIDINGGVFMG